MKINNLKVEDVCEFVGGSQPPKSEFINEPREGYVRLIQTRDYKTDAFPTYIPENSTKKFCEEQDVMIGRYGPPIFQICRGLVGAYNVALLKAVPREGIDREFLYYFLKQESVFQYVDKLSARTGGQTGIDLASLNKYPIRIPESIDHQKDLVASLHAIDKKIELNNLININLEKLARTLFDYWFLQFDFPDENGKPYKTSGGEMIYSPSLKREIPKGWNASALSKITSVSSQSLNPADCPDTEFKHFSIPVFDKTGSFAIELGRTIGSNKFIVLESDVLVSKLNPSFSRVIYAEKAENSICSTEFVVWRTSSQEIKNFLYMIAKSPQFKLHCTQSATGTSNSHKRVNPDVMMGFKVPFNAEIIESFGKKIESIIKQQLINQRENEQLSALRDWLLPMLMNGQVKVK